jgi:23S rRNA pseudouridine1911/1915/1917 synthase
MTIHYPKAPNAAKGPGETALAAVVPPDLAGERLDQVLARLFPQYSRSRIQAWMRAGRATLDGREARLRERVQGGEEITLLVVEEPVESWASEELPLCVVHEDADILVVDKPAGLVVHPGAGNRSGTLVNALLHHDARLANVPRAGVVHRIDKDTTGLLVVARTLPAHAALVAALQERRISREYDAIVSGRIIAGGSVDAPLGRHRVHRTRMAVSDNGREARTHYRVRARYRAHTRLRVTLDTGRTHQIRVHMAHIGHPLLGDRTYGARLRVPPGADAALVEVLRGFRRQALHAARLALEHPVTGAPLAWEAPPPADMAMLVEALESDARTHGEDSS